MALKGLAAVTVTFNPRLEDQRLETQIRQLKDAVVLHVIVDNGSVNLSEIERVVARQVHAGCRVRLLSLGLNRGIGAALNEGVRLCREVSAMRWVLTLDQDTILAAGAFSLVGRELGRIPDLDQVGIVALNYIEHRFNQARPYNRGAGPTRAKSVITSGSIVNRSVLDSIGFDEGLFLYFVDVDFCHRVRQLGYPIIVLKDAFIDHQEGSSVERTGSRVFFLDPPRLYFVCRNSIVVFRRYASLKALLVAGYLVSMNLLGATSRRSSLSFAWSGLLATLRPDLYPPPIG